MPKFKKTYKVYQLPRDYPGYKAVLMAEFTKEKEAVAYMHQMESLAAPGVIFYYVYS